MDRLLSGRVFKAADAFRMLLEFGPSAAPAASSSERELQWDALVRLPRALATVELQWDESDTQTAVVERFTQRLSAVQASHGEERLHVSIRVASGDWGSEDTVKLQFQHSLSHPALRCISLARVTSSGSVNEHLLRALFAHCQLEGVWKLKGSEGYGNFWATCIDPRQLSSLRNLNLSYCGLTTLPSGIGALSTLRILRLSHNKLNTLPAELGQLKALEVLAADANQLLALPLELRNCASLRELNLEGNRIASAVLDVRMMQHTLQSLQLFGNPLEYLPELLPCTQLRSLSFANVRIMADATYTRWEVEVAALPYMARGHKLAPLFRLAFRRASLQHPLLAGALGRIAEDKGACELIAKEEVAIQQLVLMSLSDSQVVVRQACKTLGLLASCGVGTVQRLMVHDIGTAVQTLIKSPHHDAQVCGLNVLSALCSSSEAVSADLLTDDLLGRLHLLICKGDPSVRQTALHCVASLAYSPRNRRAIRASPGLLSSITMLAQAPSSHSTHSAHSTHSMSRATSRTFSMSPQQQPFALSRQVLEQQHLQQQQQQQQQQASSANGSVVGANGTGGGKGDGTTFGVGLMPVGANLGFASGSTRLSALRVLAVLGENEVVREALNLPPIQGRGVRVLALDGGGMKGIALVQMLRAMQARLPQPLHTYWDLVVGTSTGAIVAVSMAMLRMPCDAVEAIYTELGRKVFNAARLPGAADEPQQVSWRDSLYRMYRSTGQHVRVAVYGSKHDPTAFESLLREFADLKKLGCLSDQLVDSASLGDIPKVALVATRTSVSPASPFVFRTYELPAGSEQLAAHMAACEGSSRLPTWQAIRASASAPYYLDDFPCGDDRFQDGAVTANNPALIALQQARLLWPWLHVECLVSLGCGAPPPARRERSTSSFLDTGSVLIESACSTDRVHEALATTLPLTPETHYFRFQPIDDRFAVELDDVTPASIAKLQAAASEYCVAHGARFDALAELLSRPAGLPGPSAGNGGAAGERGSVGSGVTASRLDSLDWGGSAGDTQGISRVASPFVGRQVSGGPVPSPSAGAAAGVLQSGRGSEQIHNLNGVESGGLVPARTGVSSSEMEVNFVASGPRLGRNRGLLVLHAPRQQPTPPNAAAADVQPAIAAALATLPAALRTTDLTRTCASAPASSLLPATNTAAVGAQASNVAGGGGIAGASGAGASGHLASTPPAGQTVQGHGSPLGRTSSTAGPSQPPFSFHHQTSNPPTNSPIAMPHRPHQVLPSAPMPQPPPTASIEHTNSLEAAITPPRPASISPPPIAHSDGLAAAAAAAAAAATAPAASSAANSSSPASASASIFSYFMPKWGNTSPTGLSMDGTPNPQPTTPTPDAGAPPASTLVAVAVPTASPTTPPDAQHLTPQPTTLPPPNQSLQANSLPQEAGVLQLEAAGAPGRPAAAPPAASTLATLWFPWSTSASVPSSPVVSPTTVSANMSSGGMAIPAPHMFSPQQHQHQQQLQQLQQRGGMSLGAGDGPGVLSGSGKLITGLPGGRGGGGGSTVVSPTSTYGSADAAQSGAFLFRTRSRTEAGPPPSSSAGALGTVGGAYGGGMGQGGIGGGGSLRSSTSSLPGALTHHQQGISNVHAVLDTIASNSGGGGGGGAGGSSASPRSSAGGAAGAAEQQELLRVESQHPPASHPLRTNPSSVSDTLTSMHQSASEPTLTQTHGGDMQVNPSHHLRQQQHESQALEQQQQRNGLQAAPSLQHLHRHGQPDPPPADHANPTASRNDLSGDLDTQPPLFSHSSSTSSATTGEAAAANPQAEQQQPASAAGASASESTAADTATGSGLNGEAAAAPSPMSGPKPSAVVQGLLEDLTDQGLGVVHVALHADAEQQALVAQWSDDVIAVMEPGPQASQLIRQLGGDPSAGDTLGHVTHGALVFHVGLTRYVRLGAHEVITPLGQQVRSVLLSVSQPSQWLTAQDVEAASVAWASLVVTASCVVPKPLLEAFMRVGVKAVVCLAEEPSSPAQVEALPAVFQLLLQLCTAGTPVMDAVAAAEAHAGGVCEGLLVCHHS